MDNIESFYPSKRCQPGDIFIILEWDEVRVAEIIQTDGLNRGGHFGKIYKMILLEKAQPFNNEIEVYDDFFYPIPKKLPSNRIVRPKVEIFVLEDIKWLLSGLSDEAEVYYGSSFVWVYGHISRAMERDIRLGRGLKEVAELQSKLHKLLDNE